ncbi:uncharacterized protein FIBRA_01347 [Fibroporia radiculosa]|uniref:Ketoreductase (KR) domain-containing protein n=1 Tax=Fibroporia radiculosa TaxID=599839 RepID=J4H120_9APHY|nr:uncharacterized protein FIBRA_01347 [Fibroporia radiculosa]CCL99329.1 predicted protein [Fibroporia radiculosa]
MPSFSPRRVATSVFAVAFYVCLSILHRTLATYGRLESRLFQLCARLLAVKPCGVYNPHECAIVVIGADEGMLHKSLMLLVSVSINYGFALADIGKHVSFRFSELGYTVFTLCRQDRHGLHSDGSTSVSSLMYEWHKVRKKSGNTAWGLIAPISLDLGDTSQHAHVFETIHAYCGTHSLRLVNVIMLLPQTQFVQDSFASYVAHHANVSSQRRDWNVIDTDTMKSWDDSFKWAVTEPVLVVQNCLDSLVASSGRVVMISECRDNVFLPSGSLSPLHGTHQSLSRYLSRELAPLGVHVSIVHAGESAALPSGSKVSSNNESGIQATIRMIQQILLFSSPLDTLRHFAVQPQEIIDLVQYIATTPYPKRRYTIGIVPLISAVLEATPQILWLLGDALMGRMS